MYVSLDPLFSSVIQPLSISVDTPQTPQQRLQPVPRSPHFAKPPPSSARISSSPAALLEVPHHPQLKSSHGHPPKKLKARGCIHRRPFRKHVLPHRTSQILPLKSLPSTSTPTSAPSAPTTLSSGTSLAHTPTSLRRSPKHCDRIKADFGGTEILPAIKSTIEWRLKNFNLKIMGQMWNSEELFKYVEKEASGSDPRPRKT